MYDQLERIRSVFPKEFHPRLLLVGGAVRDILCGIECHDFDLIAFLSPAELAPLHFSLVQGKSTPNIFFRFHKSLGKIEITALLDSSAVLEDLKRRDFTVNALIMTLDGVLWDPLGGEADLKEKRLRTCSATSLFDDPARIFRAFRFECDGFRLDDDAEATISGADWDQALAALPAERFSAEMLKAIAKPDPCRFFRRMLELSVGASVLPEIFRMAVVPAGPPEHHPEGDLFTHSMQVLERLSAKSSGVEARFCALFHDLGKLSTDPALYPKHHGHEEAGRVAAEPFCRRLRLPSPLIKGLQGTCRLHQSANRWEELRDSTKIRVAVDAVKCGIAGFLPLIVEADCGRTMRGWEEALRVATLNVEELGFARGYFDKNEIPPGKRGELIMQRRVQALRKGEVKVVP